jgi:hypothetical protein
MYTSFLLAALAFSTTASAGIYTGNPNVNFQATRADMDFIAGTADVQFVRIHNCDGSHDDYDVVATVDPVLGFDVTVSGGDLCAAEVFWGSNVYITGKSFTLKAAPGSTVVDLAPLNDADLTPFAVVAGSMPNPEQGPLLVPTVH